MESLKSHFVFNRSQRNGILFLILLIILLLAFYHFVDFSEDDNLNTNSPEIILIQKEIDSLRTLKIAAKKPKQYPFNPNFITDFKGYTLGMSPKELDRLHQFRKENKWINSVQDFQKVTKVSDSILLKISPYFKFPNWVTNQKSTKDNFKGFKEKTYSEKIDLNIATEDQFQTVKGIGPALSKRIVAYRKRLGGFATDSQLNEVYGLDFQVVQQILIEFTVKTPKEIVKMNLNAISASDIATIPGISFELAKRIWEYRLLNEKINDFMELEKIEGMTERKLIGIQLYLTLE